MDKRDRNPSFSPKPIDPKQGGGWNTGKNPAPAGANKHVGYSGGFIQPGSQDKAYGGWNKYEGGSGKAKGGSALKGHAATYKTRNQQMGGAGSHG